MIPMTNSAVLSFSIVIILCILSLLGNAKFAFPSCLPEIYGTCHPVVLFGFSENLKKDMYVLIASVIFLFLNITQMNIAA